MSYQNMRNILITGGAGFIGSNLAERLLSEPNTRIRILDNLSRKGTASNLSWLQSLPGKDRLEFVKGDVRDAALTEKITEEATEIYHFAAQVAVTTSVTDPRQDLDVNVQGTFNVLEGARKSGLRPFFLFTSTNKVYGSLPRLEVKIEGQHYKAAQPQFEGVGEDEPLDFHSPYGCSKGSADQYVRDYARIYEIPSVVFRMSCIAGPRQFGNEDQGWVAHFLYSVLEGSPITIYGNGYQVRDVLHVHDLIDAMQAAFAEKKKTQGEIFNLGGGLHQSVSVLEMLKDIQKKTGMAPVLEYSDVRPGDQPLYISDTNKFSRYTGWKAKRSTDQILQDILHFWKKNRDLILGQRNNTPSRPFVTEEVA